MGLVRIEICTGMLHDIQVDDPDAFVSSFEQGLRIGSTWYRSTNDVIIQGRHIARMWVRERDMATEHPLAA